VARVIQSSGLFASENRLTPDLRLDLFVTASIAVGRRGSRISPPPSARNSFRALVSAGLASIAGRMTRRAEEWPTPN
jgi:hypothetical protein